MNRETFIKKMEALDLTRAELATKLGVTIGEIDQVLEQDKIPPLYQWAIFGLEFSQYTSAK